MAERLIWLKEEILPVSKATINVLSPTSQFGANVFEGIRCYWNKEEKQLYAFRLEDHLKRLMQSAKAIGFEEKYTLEELKKHFIEIIKANDYHEDIAVRQTLFLDGFGSWSSKEPVEMFIAPIPKGRFNEGKGLTCCISSWERINEKSMSPKIKCGANYINSRMAQLEATNKGYDTAIFLNNKGTIAEAPGSCVFIVKAGTLITPPLSASILDSITRETIIELANKTLKIPVQEKDILPKDLTNADEIFLCGTAIEITPITNMEGKSIPKGPITTAIEQAHFQAARHQDKHYKRWLMSIY